jgi:glycosyltransferase involved in cell wall biosynthesis
MDILVMASRDPENPAMGGGEVVLSEFAKALSRRGHQVHYLCSAFQSSSRETWTDGIHVMRLASETFLGPAVFAAYERRFRNRVDVVLEDILGGSRIPFFAPLYVKEPLISLWFQDHLPIFREQFRPMFLPALTLLEKLLVRVHDDCNILVPSVAAKVGLVRKGMDPAKIRIYYPGIAQSFFELGPPPSVEGRSRRVVYLGKIRRYKCIHHAIHAMARVVKQVPQAKLTIVGRVGQKEYLAELISLTKKLRLEAHVDFELGASENRKIELLRTSRALLSPAPIEGFGIAIIEANACGVPVVGSYGVPEDSLQEGVNGFRVAFGDVTGMAERLVTLLMDDEVFTRLSSGGYQFARQFTWEKAVEPLVDLIDNLKTREGHTAHAK